MEKKEIKAWAVADVSGTFSPNDMSRVFYGVDGGFHIFRTKKNAQDWLESQFFYTKGLKWKPVKISIHQ